MESEQISEDIRFETVTEDGQTYYRYVRTFPGIDADGKPTIHELAAPWMRDKVKAQFAFVEQFPGYAVRTIFGDGGNQWSVTY